MGLEAGLARQHHLRQIEKYLYLFIFCNTKHRTRFLLHMKVTIPQLKSKSFNSNQTFTTEVADQKCSYESFLAALTNNAYYLLSNKVLLNEKPMKNKRRMFCGLYIESLCWLILKEQQRVHYLPAKQPLW